MCVQGSVVVVDLPKELLTFMIEGAEVVLSVGIVPFIEAVELAQCVYQAGDVGRPQGADPGR